ncbi:MAG: site-2 protease family protein [Chitinophagaceae bacterium]|nr:site-2 protease family protein [Chitinophagaceae bacterium]
MEKKIRKRKKYKYKIKNMKGSFKLGNIAGIGVFIHWTFSILIAYIIFSNYRAGHDAERIGWMVLFVCSIFGTVFLHELGHALAAKRYGINTKDITILPIGGLARLEKIPEKPVEELVVALAGPAVNIALAGITALFITMPSANELSIQLAGGVNSDNFFLNFFIVNIWLAVFNLIPAFPMDGGRVLRALLAMKMQRHIATTVAARIGQVLALGFIFLGFFGNPFLIFIGLFIILGAQGEAQMTKAEFMMKGILVKDILMKNYETIEESDTIETAVNKLLNGQCKNFVVMANQKPVATLGRDEIIKALSDNGKQTLLYSVADKNPIRLNVNQSLEEVYPIMIAGKNSLAFVYDNQQFIGVLDLENILEFIMVKEAEEKK